jgi:transcriptional regulator with XRE-family HTH domain
MTTKEKFTKLVSKETTNTIANNIELIKHRDRLRESQSIALKVLDRLDELNWTQRDLAKKMGISAQQINKIVRGKENLTLGTQIQLQKNLDIPILATYYENKLEENFSIFESIFKQETMDTFSKQRKTKVSGYLSSNVLYESNNTVYLKKSNYTKLEPAG